MNHPYLKFYVRDWISDPQLRMVSLSARGLWFECLCIMHMAKRRGFLESPNGNPIREEELGGLIGRFKGPIRPIMDELLAHGIPSVEEETGIWYCRRMVKDEETALKCSVAGKRGGGSPLLASSPEDKRTALIHHNHIEFKPTVYTAEFDDFWKAYPKKVKKIDAWKAWVQTSKLRPDNDLLIKAIEDQKHTDSWKKDGGQFIPYPASWLRSGAWSNDVSAMNGRAEQGRLFGRVGGNADFSDTSTDPLVEVYRKQHAQRAKR